MTLIKVVLFIYSGFLCILIKVLMAKNITNTDVRQIRCSAMQYETIGAIPIRGKWPLPLCYFAECNGDKQSSNTPPELRVRHEAIPMSRSGGYCEIYGIFVRILVSLILGLD